MRCQTVEENEMTIKDIVLHMGPRERSATRLESALSIAQTHHAHLTGVHVIEDAIIPAYAEAQIPSEILFEQQRIMERRADEAKEMFEAAAQAAGVAFEWRVMSGDPVQAVSLNARYADLVIAGQPEDTDTDRADLAVTEHLALESGRPVLVIPYIGAKANLGERIIIAWNGSRESVRAVSDAMPFLMRAREVVVLAINPKGGPSGHGDIPSADMSLHLARHGVRADAQEIVAEDIAVGDVLLSRAADEGADMIVMGAYGHSRFRELVLGGATRHLLQHMTVPILMSH